MGFLRSAVVLLALGCAAGVALASDVLPGFDFFVTPPGGAVLDVGGGGTGDPDDDIPPLPPGFFYPGSDPFIGVISFAGTPVAPGSNADTIVERLELAILPDPTPVSDTIDIELVALSLVSVSPITVGTTTWDVSVGLSGTDPSLGTMTIHHATPTGGIYDAEIFICGLHTFTQVTGPSPGTTIVVENCADLGLPLRVGVLGQPWGHDPVGSPPAGAGPNFFILGPQFDSGPHPSMNPASSMGLLCGDSFPECDGDCPPGLTCTPQPGGANDCICVPPPVPMGTPWGYVALFLALMAGVALLVARVSRSRAS